MSGAPPSRIHADKRVIDHIDILHEAEGVRNIALHGVHSGEAAVVGVVHAGLGVVLVQNVVVLVPGVGNLGQQDAEAAVHGDAVVRHHAAPGVVINPGGDAAVLVAQVHHTAQPVGVHVVGEDALLDVLPPPVAALAGHLHVDQIQAVHVAEVVAVHLVLHQHPLVDVQPGVVNDVVAEHHLRALGALQAGFHAGRLAVEVRVPVGIVVQDQLRAHAHAQAVVGVVAVLPVRIGARDHLVRLVVPVGGDGDVPRPLGGGRADLLLLHQVAPLVVGIAVVVQAGDAADVAAVLLVHHLVQIVVLVGQRGLLPFSDSLPYL